MRLSTTTDVLTRADKSSSNSGPCRGKVRVCMGTQERWVVAWGNLTHSGSTVDVSVRILDCIWTRYQKMSLVRVYWFICTVWYCRGLHKVCHAPRVGGLMLVRQFVTEEWVNIILFYLFIYFMYHGIFKFTISKFSNYRKAGGRKHKRTAWATTP